MPETLAMMNHFPPGTRPHVGARVAIVVEG